MLKINTCHDKSGFFINKFRFLNCRGKKCYQSLYSDLSFTPRGGTGSELPDPGFKKLNKKKVLRKEKIIIFEAENWAEAEELAA